MKYIQYDTLEETGYKDDVWQLLCQYDHDFIPALSSRQSTSQSDLSKAYSRVEKPYSYFENLLQQSIILTINEQNRAVGFMSYKASYKSNDLQDQVDTVYITTIIVDKTYRGQGITFTLYKHIESIASQLNKPIMTRTWSTNEAHIRVLNKIGMLEIKRLYHARGTNIDTVYYRK